MIGSVMSQEQENRPRAVLNVPQYEGRRAQCRGPFNMLLDDYRASAIGYTDANVTLQAQFAKCKHFFANFSFSKNKMPKSLYSPCFTRGCISIADHTATETVSWMVTNPPFTAASV